MRLYLLPISTRRALVYCQRVKTEPTAKSSYVDRATHKAAETWSKWESYEGGWQKKVTEYGNKALQRIPYEEWGLKSIPALSAKRKAEDIKDRGTLEVLYPGNVVKEQDIPALLRKLGTERQMLHRQRAYWSLIVTPLTIPFGLIPVLPNLPFFYLAYRSWSHFKALWGSQHLVYLVDKGGLKPTPLSILENIYATKGKPQPFVPEAPSSPNASEHLLLDDTSHTVLAKNLEFPELAVEVERAVKQVRKAIETQHDVEKQKQDLEKEDAEKTKEQQPPSRR